MKVDIKSNSDGWVYAVITHRPPNGGVNEGFKQIVWKPNIISKFLWGSFKDRIHQAKENAKDFEEDYKKHNEVDKEGLAEKFYIDRIKYCKKLSDENKDKAMKWACYEANKEIRENSWYYQ